MRLIIIRRVHMLIAALLILALLGSLTYMVLSAPALPVVEITSPSGDRLPIYSVSTGRREVALTFDATWGAEHTPTLLSVLEEKDVQVTFFLTNIWMEDYPEETRSIFEHGHEIGLHSAGHEDMATLSSDQIKTDLTKNQEKLQAICSKAEPQLFRPPFGAYDDNLLQTAEDELGLTTIQWSVDSLDWKEDISADYIVNRVTTLVHPGAIILFHNNAKHTPEALPTILQFLEDNDYTAVTVSDLLHCPPYEIDHRGQQIPLDDADSPR